MSSPRISPATSETSATGVARLGSVGLLDRVDELALVHRGASRDVETLGDVVEVRLAGVGVDAFVGRAASARCRAGLLGLLVRRALLVLGLPVVADLLVAVLHRRERCAVRAFAFAVLGDGG